MGAGPRHARRRGYQRDLGVRACRILRRLSSMCWPISRAMLLFPTTNSTRSATANAIEGCALSAPLPASWRANVCVAFFRPASVCDRRSHRGAGRRLPSVEQLDEFYHHHYFPANALLIVVGDFSAGPMLAQIEKDLRQSGEPRRPRALISPAPPRIPAATFIWSICPAPCRPKCLLGNLAITRRDPDWYRIGPREFDLRRRVSFAPGDEHSRAEGLHLQPAQRSSTRCASTGISPSHAAVRNEVAAATLTEIFYEMDRMRSLPVTAEELESARSYLTGVFSSASRRRTVCSRSFPPFISIVSPEDHLETYRERIHALTADDILAAARRHFDSANAQIVLVGDRAQIADQAALFGAVTEYDAQGASSTLTNTSERCRSRCPTAPICGRSEAGLRRDDRRMYRARPHQLAAGSSLRLVLPRRVTRGHSEACFRDLYGLLCRRHLGLKRAQARCFPSSTRIGPVAARPWSSAKRSAPGAWRDLASRFSNCRLFFLFPRRPSMRAEDAPRASLDLNVATRQGTRAVPGVGLRPRRKQLWISGTRAGDSTASKTCSRFKAISAMRKLNKMRPYLKVTPSAPPPPHKPPQPQ